MHLIVCIDLDRTSLLFDLGIQGTVVIWNCFANQWHLSGACDTQFHYPRFSSSSWFSPFLLCLLLLNFVRMM